jgi:hypothetical protein
MLLKEWMMEVAALRLAGVVDGGKALALHVACE